MINAIRDGLAHHALLDWRWLQQGHVACSRDNGLPERLVVIESTRSLVTPLPQRMRRGVKKQERENRKSA